jgi:regulator of cell morphogenesis and NO signaling
MNAPISPETPLSEIATHHAAASRVFQRHRLDFCCHGARPLAEACAHRGLDSGAVIREILADDDGVAPLDGWSDKSLDELVHHVVDHYHARLRAELPALVAMARRVETRHGDKPTCPIGLAAHLEAMERALVVHMEKEERALFPALLAGQGRLAATPIRVMEAEHQDHGAALEVTRGLTKAYQPPPEACPTWRALYLRLRDLELELMNHIHLENHVLFPRALRG